MTNQQIIIAIIISNTIAVLFTVLCWKRKNAGRICFSALFLWAAVTNWRIAHNNPEVYLDYKKYAIPLYRHIIEGPFKDHITGFVSLIAIGPLMTGLGLLSRDIIVKIASAGGIIFLLAIAPLGMGAAFPFSIIASAGLLILYRNHFEKNILNNKWLV